MRRVSARIGEAFVLTSHVTMSNRAMEVFKKYQRKKTLFRNGHEMEGWESFSDVLLRMDSALQEALKDPASPVARNVRAVLAKVDG